MLVFSRHVEQEIVCDLSPLIEAASLAASQGATEKEMRSHLIDALNGLTTITVKFIRYDGFDRARIGTTAARMIGVHRAEVFEGIQKEPNQ